MATKFELREWLVEALHGLGGRGTITEVCKAIWTSHESDLKDSGDLLFTWQYDLRWAALELRKEGKLAAIEKRGAPWQLPTSSI